MEINQRVFLIAGGSSGLGAATAKRLAAQGAKVVIADVRPPEDAALLESDGVRFYPTDVTSEVAVQEALHATRGQFGALHGAVICAGILFAAKVVGSKGPFDLAAFRRVIEVNLIGTFNVMRLAADLMQHNPPGADGERGVIVTTSSVSAFEGQMGQAAYSASKGGVAALTLPAARDLARLGIRVISIAPGVFETPMMQQAPEKVRTSLAAQIPFPSRFGDPDEYAAFAQHIIENRMINGAVLRIDGAIRMQVT